MKKLPTRKERKAKETKCNFLLWRTDSAYGKLISGWQTQSQWKASKGRVKSLISNVLAAQYHEQIDM